MVKPDGVQRGLTGEIIQRFEKRGYKMVGCKMVWPSKELLEKHYADLSGQPFFAGLIAFMATGPVVAMVWEGKEIIKMGRMMLGATNPQESAPGTLRGDYSIDVTRNIIHGSDGVDIAKKEIGLWFKPEEMFDYKSCLKEMVYE
ncbi:hypothetical protein FSP39_023617 [Pinctada imbricata]|uniref:Nucleoside diphosphate kinase n=1 Tax=Pinctada imbricata TaxID=66713 RepID=A0AA88XU39_PINIB|nr:hypothetical protein FSP39_023617 [Pinctada imbricata]